MFDSKTIYLVFCAAVLLSLGPIAGRSEAQFKPITIVSIGDSYASGEGAPDGFSVWGGDNRDGRAVACHRSAAAAPAVAARSVAASRPASSFTHVACSGATTSNMANQLATAASIVGGPIDALIVSIGGNDIGFAAIVGACLALPCEVAVSSAPNWPALATGLDSLTAAIRGLSVPVKHVFITEYPDPSTTLFPPGRCGPPFNPNVPGSGFEGIDVVRAQVLVDTIVTPLNASLRDATVRANALSGAGGPVFHFVTGISDAFQGHGYCMGFPNPTHLMFGSRMVNGLADSYSVQNDYRGTMHPNASGQNAAAGVIAAAIHRFVPAVPLNPATERQLCLQDCAAEQGECMREAHSGPERGNCAREAQQCRRECMP